jgi:hypothetical protein
VAISRKANICAEKMGSRWVVYGYGGAVIDSGSRYGLVPYISFGNDVLDGKNAIGSLVMVSDPIKQSHGISEVAGSNPAQDFFF